MYDLSFQVKYTYPDGDGIQIPVKISFGNQSIATNTKLDTGCSNCIFRRQIGEALGLDIESGQEQRFSSVHGTAITYGHFVTLSVLDLSFDVMVYFAADDYFPRNLLGRHGWLDQVRVGLIDYEGLLFLNRYAD